MKTSILLLTILLTTLIYAQSPLLVVNPAGHRGQVRDLAVSNDKKYVITAGFDKTIKKWNIELGEVVQEYRGKIGAGAEGLVYFIELSPDNKYLAAGGWFGADDESEDVGDIRVFDYETGKLVHVLKGLSSPPLSLHFSDDSKTIFAGDIYSKILKWDVASEKLLGEFVYHKFETDKFLLGHTGRGQEMMSVDEQGHLCLWDTEKPNKPIKIDKKTIPDVYKLGHNLGLPGNLAISPDGEEYAFSIENYLVLMNKKFKTYFLIENKYKPGFIKFSQSGKRLLTGCVARGSEQHAYVFEKQSDDSWKEIADFAEAKASMICGDFIDENTVVTAGGEENDIYIWSVNKATNGKQHLLQTFKSNGLNSHAVGLNTGVIAYSEIWTENFGLSAFNKEFDLFQKTITAHQNKEFQRPIDKKGEWEIKWCRTEAGLDGLTAGLEIKQKGQAKDTLFRDQFNGSRHVVYTFAPNGMIISGGNYGHIEVYGTDKKLYNRFVGHGGVIYGMAVSSDNTKLITCSDDNTIRIWPLDKLGHFEDNQIPHTFEEYIEQEIKYKNIQEYLKGLIKKLNLEELARKKSIAAWDTLLEKLKKADEYDVLSIYEEVLNDYRCTFIYPLVSIFMTTDGEWIIWNEQGYFSASKKGAKYVGYYLNQGKDKEAKFFPFEQFDLKYNRPDLILRDLDLGSEQIRNFYYRAYLKRLKKMNLSESDLAGDLNLPHIKINQTTLTEDKKRLTVQFSVWDEQYDLDRINVFINDVPIYGRSGIPLTATQKSEQQLEFDLADGKNKVQISVLNKKGVESTRETYYAFNAKSEEKPSLYLITIGTSQFKDKRFNLKYAAKDARDMVAKFSNGSAFAQIYQETLLDEMSTKENILNLKKFLEQAGRNDVVMIFVAGHGLLDENLDYYYATFDTDFNDPAKRGLLYAELEELLDGITALKKLLFMDTCHSGEVDKDEIEKGKTETKVIEDVQFRNAGQGVRKKEGVGILSTGELVKELYSDLRRGTGATIISSAGGVEFAMESDAWKNGLFTYCLLEGLSSGRADLNADGLVYLSEIQAYLQDEVRIKSEGQQQPSSRRENLSLDYPIWKK